MKKHITDPQVIARRERRKKELLWQGEQLEREAMDTNERPTKEIRKNELGLKPCPFCGQVYDLVFWEDDIHKGHYQVVCNGCGASTGYDEGKEDSAKLWNIRVPPPEIGKNYPPPSCWFCQSPKWQHYGTEADGKLSFVCLDCASGGTYDPKPGCNYEVSLCK